MESRYEIHSGGKKVTTLGGYYFENGNRVQLEFIKNPEISQVDEAFKKCMNSGIVSIKKYIGENGEVSLTITCYQKTFMPICGYEADEDYVIITLHDETLPDKLIDLLGEKYPERATTKDQLVVRSIYVEFLAGKLPSQLS